MHCIIDKVLLLPPPFFLLLSIKCVETMITAVVIDSNKTIITPPTPPNIMTKYVL